MYGITYNLYFVLGIQEECMEHIFHGEMIAGIYLISGIYTHGVGEVVATSDVIRLIHILGGKVE